MATITFISTEDTWTEDTWEVDRETLNAIFNNFVGNANGTCIVHVKPNDLFLLHFTVHHSSSIDDLDPKDFIQLGLLHKKHQFTTTTLSSLNQTILRSQHDVKVNATSFCIMIYALLTESEDVFDKISFSFLWRSNVSLTEFTTYVGRECEVTEEQAAYIMELAASIASKSSALINHNLVGSLAGSASAGGSRGGEIRVGMHVEVTHGRLDRLARLDTDAGARQCKGLYP